ncbi:hypothetical protein FE394_00555 [Xenorhabdus sp. Reich]|uniref:Teneurin-like YD-shell domain-containing protein n=1 Tax=Xenorhabdus littoralis TaxID=2582835 RepID=A0ABU4SGG6_9GAMM|nr:RHS repeat-associated core domain-containing protein [Xenorhabdus sp. Reich]MDX7997724.1 hypothetical protein [Xenorhabdus sp. Reich]
MNNTFFSNAHNFQSAATSGVDPRTGLFNYTLLVAQISGNNHLGPDLTMALSYSPLNTKNTGFGIGFTSGLTQYDRQNRLLMLASGERYKVIETDQTVYLKQYKQDVVRFEKDTKQNVYRVIHKSGRIEVLTGAENGYDLKVPTQIFSPLGHSLTLDWDFNRGVIPYLTRISDETQVLLTVNYELGVHTKITVWPDTSESHEIQLLFQNEYVTQVKNTAIDPTLVWQLGYSRDHVRLLTEITFPTGLIEHVDYQSDGHRFPENVPLSPLPYVTRYTQYPGHGPAIVRTYQYTDLNFLGYGGFGNWDRDEDYLYSMMTDYQYGSTEIWDDGTSQRHITRRYNNYHLLVSETIQQNQCKREHRTDYYAQIGVAFEQQPAQFQMPKSATVRFNDEPDGDVIQTEFDAAGNPMMQIAQDGTRTDWIYYSADGEGDDCPPSPHGFVRFVKSQTVTPGRSSPEGAYDDAPVHQTIYRYSRFPTREGTPAAYAVVRTYQGLFSTGQLLHERQTHYINAVSSPDHGRLQRIEETVHEATPAAARQGWTSQQTFSYSVQGDNLVQSTQWTGHDQLSYTTHRTQSRFSGQVRHEMNAQKCTCDYYYDGVGRLLKQVTNAETDYAHEIKYAYAFEEDGFVTTTQTDVWGNQQRTRVDGLGRPYQQEVLEKGQEAQGWRKVAETAYDSWGRGVSQTHYDRLPVDNDDGSEAGSETLVAARLRFEYDDWGQQHRTIQDTGESAQQDYDPVTRTTQITRQAGGLSFAKSTVVYDQNHRPVTTTLYDRAGKPYSQQSHQYDGLGRVRATIDVLGQKTAYAYDVFGRVSTLTHSDGTVVRKSYAPFSSGNLVTQIEAGGHVLGTRSFDSLHRQTSITCGGRTAQATYQDVAPLPCQVTDPSGQTMTYDYEMMLGNALTRASAGDMQQYFTYEPKTGVMTQACAARQATRRLSYTPAGRLQQESFRFDETAEENNERQANYIYSSSGVLTGYQDVTGTHRSVHFDPFGRPVFARDTDIEVSFTYDAASRVRRWQVYDIQHQQTCATALEWDEFGREIYRQIQTATETLTLEQTYTVKGQLASRLTHSQQSGVLRQESYTYDPARGWLMAYVCTGVECPRDAYGFVLASQRFTYDRLGNILTCTSNLEDGSTDTATFRYSASDPCQLHTITHTHPGYPAVLSLKYDQAGRLIEDEAGRQLTYDALGRLAAVSLDDTTSTYAYDATNRLVQQQIGTDNTHELYYRGASRVVEILRESGVATRLLRARGEAVATVTGNDSQLLGTDGHSSVLLSHQADGSQTRHRYSPHGQQAEEERHPAIPAYNGERLDPVGGVYHLGNGYRAYNPVLMRFNAPDSWSPFGAGGLNAYAYCQGDPINHTDPSGHMSLGNILGIAFGAIGLIVGLVMAVPTGGASLAGDLAIISGLIADVTGIASAVTEESNPQASAILGGVSILSGVFSLGAGTIGGIARGMRRVGEKLIGSFAPGLSGRGAVGAGAQIMGRQTTAEGAFTQAINNGWIQEIEHPAGSGFHTLQLTAPEFVPSLSVIHEDYPLLMRLGFDPMDVSMTGGRVSQIDNTAMTFGGAPPYIDITINTVYRLYAPFITENTGLDAGRTMIKILHSSIVERFTNGSLMYRTPFDQQYIHSISHFWSLNGVSHSPQYWLLNDMMERDVSLWGLIVNTFGTEAATYNNIDIFSFYNTLISGLP